MATSEKRIAALPAPMRPCSDVALWPCGPVAFSWSPASFHQSPKNTPRERPVSEHDRPVLERNRPVPERERPVRGLSPSGAASFGDCLLWVLPPLGATGKGPPLPVRRCPRHWQGKPLASGTQRGGLASGTQRRGLASATRRVMPGWRRGLSCGPCPASSIPPDPAPP